MTQAVMMIAACSARSKQQQQQQQQHMVIPKMHASNCGKTVTCVCNNAPKFKLLFHKHCNAGVCCNV